MVLSGRAAAVVGAIDGGLLIQVPRGISTGRQVLRIDNGLGTAEITVSTAFYAFGGDAAGNGLRIRRLGPEGEQPEMFDDKPLDIAFPLSRYQALSTTEHCFCAGRTRKRTKPRNRAAARRSPSERWCAT